MASLTRKTDAKRRQRRRAMGRKRKNKLMRKSTKSAAELFADFGAPGKPASKKKAAKA